MIIVRRLGQCREIGDLGQRECVNGLAEIIQRRRGNPVITEAEIDFIQIEIKNTIFGEGRFDFERQQHFLDLAVKCLNVGEQEVFGDLLRDCRGPLPPPGIGDIVHYRTGNSLGINADMAVEILVLG